MITSSYYQSEPIIKDDESNKADDITQHGSSVNVSNGLQNLHLLI